MVIYRKWRIEVSFAKKEVRIVSVVIFFFFLMNKCTREGLLRPALKIIRVALKFPLKKVSKKKKVLVEIA